MNNKVFRVLARKEVIYVAAGLGASTAAYFAGKKMEKRRRYGRLMTTRLDEQLRDEVIREPEFEFMEKHHPHYDFDAVAWKERLADLVKEYRPGPDDYKNVLDLAVVHPKSVIEFERQAIPMADEILGQIEVVEPYEELEPLEAPEFTPKEIHNIFAGLSSDDGWDYDEETANRSPDKPYVIHQDEFVDSDSGFTQTTVTFYAEDQVVADSLDTPVDDWERVLGQLKFGHGTTDKNVVYIRNEKLQSEFEVLLHSGSYLSEILGQEAELRIAGEELKHSMGMKFRGE